MYSGQELWRYLRLFSFGSYGLAFAALALAVFGAIECIPIILQVIMYIMHEFLYHSNEMF